MGVAGQERMLLEREREFLELGSRCREAVAGRGGVLAVQGPGGIGKSALLGVAEREGAAAGLFVLKATGSELERELAFGVVRQLFERHLLGLPDDVRGEIFDGAARLATPVFELEPAPPRPEAVHAAMHGLYWLAADLAARRPLLLLVDDAHWVDAASLRWLAYLGRRLDGVPLLAVIARRDAEPGADAALVDQVTAETGGAGLRPQPLTRAAVARWLADAYGQPAGHEFVHACLTATGGNPFLLRELVTALGDDALRRDAAASLIETVAPASIARSVLLRLAPLGAAATAVAEAAAVLSTDAHLGRVAALADLPLPQAAEIVDRLAAAEILSSGEPLLFRHPILRSAVYEQIPLSRRGLGHLAAAEQLLRDGAGHERVAGHLVQAPPGGRPWVVSTLRGAASAAIARGAPDAAVSLLRRALAEPPVQRADVLLELAVAETTIQDPVATEHAREAMVAAAEPRQRAQAAIVAATALILPQRFPEALEVLGEAERELSELDAASRRAVQSQTLMLWSLHQGVVGLEERLSAVGVEHLEGETPDERVLLALLVMEFVVSGRRRDDALRLTRRLLAGEDVAQPTDDRVLLVLGRCLGIADALDEARDLFTSVVHGGRDRGAVATVATGCAMRAEIELRAGRLSEAEADAHEALRIAVDNDAMAFVPGPLAGLVDVLVERAPAPTALQLLARYGFDGDSLPPGYASHLLLHARGRAHAAAGDAEAAVANFRACGRAQTAWGDHNPASLPWRSSLAVALASLGRTEEPAQLLDEELRLAHEFGATRAIGIALRARASVERGAAPLDSLREAARILADGPARLEHARVLVDLGTVLRHHGRRLDARATLAQGLDGASRCGAHRLAARARDELKVAGARPRRERLSGSEALTASELRAAELAAQGLTNRQIAQALFVTTKTIEMHLARVYAKLDIRGRGELQAALAGSG